MDFMRRRDLLKLSPLALAAIPSFSADGEAIHPADKGLPLFSTCGRTALRAQANTWTRWRSTRPSMLQPLPTAGR